MNVIRWLSGAFVGLWVLPAFAEVYVAPVFAAQRPEQAVVVKAAQYIAFPLGTLNAGDVFQIQLVVDNAVYKDISVYMVDAANYNLLQRGLAFSGIGVTKKMSPIAFNAQAQAFGPHFLVIDNRFAAVIDKQVRFQLKGVTQMAPEQVAKLKQLLENMYGSLKREYEFQDFDMRVEPCGQSNAFSAHATGNVTLCTEIMADLIDRPGAFTAILMHELGHTLMNLWGLPNFDNEDDADQFAVMALLAGGDSGRRALGEWIQFWSERDTHAEMAHMVTYGDKHALSIQRIRNIQGWIANEPELRRRWNTILYRHMTPQALQRVIDKPGPHDNAERARQELAQR